MLDQSVLIAITLLLVGAVAYAIWQSRKREALEQTLQPYDESTCVTLAETNKANIKTLSEKANNIETLASQLTAIQSQCQANADAIAALIQQKKP